MTTTTSTPPPSVGGGPQPRRLPPDHPALAYVDDASALLNLIREEPDLFRKDNCFRELKFLRNFVVDFGTRFSSSADGRGKEATVAGGDDCDGHDAGAEGDGDGDDADCDGGGGGMDVDEDVDCDGGGDGEDDGGATGGAEEEGDDDGDDEGGYWDDEEDDEVDATIRDLYVWPPPSPPSPPPRPEPSPDGDAHAGTDAEAEAEAYPKEGADEDDGDDDEVEAYECVVIGAGAAGIGVSTALVAGGMKRRNLLVVESDTVGSSFDSWPPHTRFISPSVYSNPFGQLDLNAVDPWSSPALEALSMGVDRGVNGDGDAHAHGISNEAEADHGSDDEKDDLEFGGDEYRDTQHLSGRQYAEYLRRVASRWSLPIREHSTVTGVRRVPGRTDAWKPGGLEIGIIETGTNSEVDRGRHDRERRLRRRRRRNARDDATAIETTRRMEGRGGAKRVIYSRFVVWCGGEWSHPAIPPALSTTGPAPKTAPSTTAITVQRPPSRTAVPPLSLSSNDESTLQPGAGTENDHSEVEEKGGEPGCVHYSRVGATKGEWRDLVLRANGGGGGGGGGEGEGEGEGDGDGDGDGGGEGGSGVGHHAVVVGAFEAGVDATCTLVELGVERVTVVEESCDVPPCWEGAVAPASAVGAGGGAVGAVEGDPVAGGTTTTSEGGGVAEEKNRRTGGGVVVSADPSASLSASSERRLRSAIATGRVTLLPGRRLIGVDVKVGVKVVEGHHDHDGGSRDGRGGRSDSGRGGRRRLRCSFVAKVARTSSSSTDGVVEEEEVEALPPSSAPVVLCTGFDPGRSCPVLASLVDWDSPPPPPSSRDGSSSEDDAVEKVTTTAQQHQRHHKHGNGHRRKHHGGPLVSEGCDESLRVPGVFVCGPMLRHTAAVRRRGREADDVGAAFPCHPWRRSGSRRRRRRGHRRGTTAEDGHQSSNDDDKEGGGDEEEQTIIFCFIYKFRTRFALVAGEILSRLVLEDHCVQGGDVASGRSSIRIDRVGHERLARVEEMLGWYQQKGMLLKDISCATCEDVLC